MTSITVQLSDEAVQYLEARIAAGEFRDVNELVASLISERLEEEEMPKWLEDELVRRIEALDRGEVQSEEITPEYWDRLRDQLHERIRRTRGEVA